MGHAAGELRRIVGAAADDHDARWRSELVEKACDQSEVAEVVDTQSHFHAVGCGLTDVDHLQTGIADEGVQGRQIGAGECVDEFVDRSQRGEVAREDGASMGGAERVYGGHSAGRVAHGEDQMPGRVVGEDGAGTFEAEPRAGAGDDDRS